MGGENSLAGDFCKWAMNVAKKSNEKQITTKYLDRSDNYGFSKVCESHFLLSYR